LLIRTPLTNIGELPKRLANLVGEAAHAQIDKG